ncbi:MBL fold metallo-hydrolase [Paenibacillus sp. IHBB 10380]|uniref:MBL fold metallo-hydrolase n=1 Tax=Paenibacillus sp. IHBB 10380 TaxID=1566358 RepID=UPI0005CFE958|nr:MBL fold metallo-hydrolase [Paenibacillus sp. IHBB 10380]
MEMVKVERDNIIRVKLPMQGLLQWVNCYLIKGDEGYTLIDTGTPNSQTIKHWEDVLKYLQIGFHNINKIIITHHHIDHYGLAARLQHLTNAPIYMSEKCYQQALKLWDPTFAYEEKLFELFIQNGVPHSLLETYKTDLEAYFHAVQAHPEIRCMEEGEAVRLGNEEYKVLDTSGHAEGHISLYNEHEQTIFCGDHIIPKILPNLNFTLGFDLNPLDSYMKTLQRHSTMQVKHAFPGHMIAFKKYNERASEILEQYQNRVENMIMYMEQPVSVFEICIKMLFKPLNSEQLKFKMFEILSYIEFLRADGKIEEAGVYQSIRKYVIK